MVVSASSAIAAVFPRKISAVRSQICGAAADVLTLAQRAPVHAQHSFVPSSMRLVLVECSFAQSSSERGNNGFRCLVVRRV